jgi:hypothetical protein
MTCGVIVPVNVELIEDALYDSTAWLPHANPQRLADDPRFATAIYSNRNRNRHHGKRCLAGIRYGQLTCPN